MHTLCCPADRPALQSEQPRACSRAAHPPASHPPGDPAVPLHLFIICFVVIIVIIVDSNLK